MNTHQELFTNNYNREKYAVFLKNFFLPEDFQYEESQREFSASFQYITSVTKLGECKSLDLIVYEVRHKGKQDPRVGLSKESFRLLANEWRNRALVFFIPEEEDAKYRLSFIEIELHEDENTGKALKKYSNPRRYSYLLGKGVGGHTPDKYLASKGRISSINDLHDRFSVEVLTKAFYCELSDWYAWAVGTVRFPNKLDDKSDDVQYNAESVIRLITRLIFVWFIKQKGLVPKEFFDEKDLKEKLLKDFNPSDKNEISLFGKGIAPSNVKSIYYKAILQNLFFAMLNSPIYAEGNTTKLERGFTEGRKDFDNNKLMRYKDKFKDPAAFLDLANSTVPFLNGGLFDCLDDKQEGNYIDGFSNREKVQNSLIVPDYLFFGEEAGKNIDLSDFYADKRKKKVSARGIIDILKRYNFTIEENMPFDQDVSLDPELLGKVFENLLAMYNPETKTTARKHTGSFYTPREIVQYMVDESLIAHLKRTVGADLEEEFHRLTQYTEQEVNLNEDKKIAIIESIYSCKVLDPACGSGAFPVGMLQQMVHILRQLDPTNAHWKDLLLKNAVDETSDAYKNRTSEERAEVIMDINRSFDEKYNNPDYSRKLYIIENCIYGVDIQSIAIQISKLRFFISLVVDQKISNNAAENFGIRPLPNLEAKFIAANALIRLNNTDRDLFHLKAIEERQDKLKCTYQKLFTVRSSISKQKYRGEIKSLREDIANILKVNNIVTADLQNKLISWDMFDQNASAPFFDSQWMFGVKGGFDIVIANPPYIEFKKLASEIKESLQEYTTTKGKYDIYVAFLELSEKLLLDQGILAYINPTTFLNRDYGKALRKFIKVNFRIISIIDFVDKQVFSNATTYTGIFIFEKQKKSLNYRFNVTKFKSDTTSKSQIRNLHNVDASYAEKFALDSSLLNNNEWNINFPLRDSIIKKLLINKTCLLGDICKYIYQGIATGKDEVFLLDEDTISSEKIELELLQPILKGRDVHKYSLSWSKLYVIYPYDKSTNDVIEEDVFQSSYPNLYKYLCKCKEKLSGRNYFDSSRKYWYELWCERCLNKFKTRKIINSEISQYNKFTIDDSGFLSNTKVYNTVLNDEFSNYYYAILGILNSKLLEFFHKSIASPKAGGAFEYKTQFLSKYPIIFNECEYNRLNFIVKDLIASNLQNKHTSCSAIEDTINSIVYRIYNLSKEEIQIVEKFSI